MTKSLGVALFVSVLVLVAAVPAAQAAPSPGEELAEALGLVACPDASGAVSPAPAIASPGSEPSQMEAAELPDPGELDFCEYEYRWVYHSCGCVKVWGIAVKEKEQKRKCCIVAGCYGWTDTGATRCTGIPCG